MPTTKLKVKTKWRFNKMKVKTKRDQTK